MGLKEFRFDEVTINFDKKRVPLSGAQREKRKGKYCYYGAQGVIDHIDDFIFDGTYLLIAEDGENLKSKKQNIAQIAEGQFWVNNHAHIVQGNEFCDTRYLCYLLNSMDLPTFGRPTIATKGFISLPPLFQSGARSHRSLSQSKILQIQYNRIFGIAQGQAGLRTI